MIILGIIFAVRDLLKFDGDAYTNRPGHRKVESVILRFAEHSSYPYLGIGQLVWLVIQLFLAANRLPKRDGPKMDNLLGRFHLYVRSRQAQCGTHAGTISGSKKC
jgi:hypothetical protein